RITSGAATIENGFLLVRFSANESKVNFSGELPFTGNLELTAANLPNVSERWMVRCSSMIRCLNLGLTPTHSVYNSEKASLWLPFPNEKVSVEYKDLEGLEGDFLTIDSTEHNLNWGAQLLKGSLTIELRATEQTPFEVLVPELANITGLRVNGVSGGGTVKDQKGLVLLSPGEHQVTLSYSIPWTPSWIEHAPLIKLSANAHNLNVNVFPSEDRWLLWTGGISWGPCVLFWGKLFFIVLLCLALTKAGLMPLGTFGAIMLGIGLTSIPIIWMFIPLAWLISLKLIPLLHEKWIMLAKPIRLIMFVGLSLLALVFFFKIVQFGLVLDPPMLVAGNQSNASHLKWFVDHTGSSLAQPWIVSLPLWSWRIFALLWSTWLILALFSWLKLAVDIEGPGQRKATSENPLE
ncbi:MAG: hypothetical protein KDD62_14485, partial [Bdellovibrionales bacterium]|nr:hypothetical protein [Bdellovibrionales bacterium]